MENILLIILIVILIFWLISSFWKIRNETFYSGLSIDDDYCMKLMDVYYKPQINNPLYRNYYRDIICGKKTDLIDEDDYY